MAFDSKLNKIYFSKQDNKGNLTELYESTFTNGVWSEPKVLFIKDYKNLGEMNHLFPMQDGVMR